MYVVTVVNWSRLTWTASDGTNIGPNGGKWQTGAIGNAWINCVQMGTMNFLDIGAEHVPGDSSETWGVLISYQGEEIVGRYEGGGKLNVTINQFMQAELSGIDLREVSLPAMTVS